MSNSCGCVSDEDHEGDSDNEAFFDAAGTSGNITTDLSLTTEC